MGFERAQCIADLWSSGHFNEPQRIRGQFNAPQRIIAQPVGGEKKSKRPVETVLPLAEKLGIPVEQECTAKEYDCIYDSVMDPMNPASPILISWEHKRMRKILHRFVDMEKELLPRIPKNRFDIVWIVDTEKRTFTIDYQHCQDYFDTLSDSDDDGDDEYYQASHQENDDEYYQASHQEIDDGDDEYHQSSHQENDDEFVPFKHLSESRIVYRFLD